MLSGKYDYNRNEDSSGSTVLLAMKTISSYTESAISLLQGTSGFISQENKGMAYFIISHAFILLFVIAVFRTIFTSPGYVPEVTFH